jgi:hypothetical protein
MAWQGQGRDDGFLSNVAPPARQRASIGRLLGMTLLALVVVSGLVGALLLAGPALDTEQQRPPEGPEAVEDR